MYENNRNPDYPIYSVSASPTIARAAAADEPTVLLALPVKGALPPALPVPIGADGLMGEPVAAPPDEEPVPVGMVTAVPVANPVEPATIDELQSRVSIEVKLSAKRCSPDGCGLSARAVDVIKGYGAAVESEEPAEVVASELDSELVTSELDSEVEVAVESESELEVLVEDELDDVA
ncbi:MAG: hypothetical protein Q9221_005064 [Calogaya cf. arnoldii]